MKKIVFVLGLAACGQAPSEASGWWQDVGRTWCDVRDCVTEPFRQELTAPCTGLSDVTQQFVAATAANVVSLALTGQQAAEFVEAQVTQAPEPTGSELQGGKTILKGCIKAVVACAGVAECVGYLGTKELVAQFEKNIQETKQINTERRIQNSKQHYDPQGRAYQPGRRQEPVKWGPEGVGRG